MESLQSLRNLETAFQKTKYNSIIFVIACTLIVLVVVYYSFTYVQSNATKVYAVAAKNGAVVELHASSVSDHREAEAKHHIRFYHDLMFNVVPDPKSIQYNKRRAEYLGDKSILLPFELYTEKNFYNQLIGNNMLQSFKEDSLVINMNSSPYKAIMYGKVKITRASSVLTNILVTSCDLVDLVSGQQTGRTEENPNGFFMQNFSILESKKFSSEVK
ncbi:conjugative transposon protein TraK [Xanthocytophaga flava]|uniref:conjugative transposon protein TraK n=1 Tax=Xanthocytophaga flava TaxID=3048013 RepID=UPI0028D3E6FB|nr:conjugative transposon protein TraK [Xanthocytophaga flavus]MDJ1470224.1 conjugative transposon protein TraK [Xanthocytophaga flavus]